MINDANSGMFMALEDIGIFGRGSLGQVDAGSLRDSCVSRMYRYVVEQQQLNEKSLKRSFL